MAITSLSAETLDSHILTLLDKLDHVQGELSPPPVRLPMHVEVRRLEFWRAIIAECMGHVLLRVPHLRGQRAVEHAHGV